MTQSRRMLAHGLVTPQLGQADLDFMDLQAATLKVDAWKAYTGAAAQRVRPWLVRRRREDRLPDAREGAQALGVRRFCVHKGLPLGPVADYNHPRDLIKAAKDFPDIDFLVYHAGLLRCRGDQPSPADDPVDDRVLPDEEAGAGPQRTSTWSWARPSGSSSRPIPPPAPTCSARSSDAFGADHVLWGTDSIWYGTPQWQIDAFRRLRDARGAGREAPVRAAHARR